MTAPFLATGTETTRAGLLGWSVLCLVGYAFVLCGCELARQPNRSSGDTNFVTPQGDVATLPSDSSGDVDAKDVWAHEDSTEIADAPSSVALELGGEIDSQSANVLDVQVPESPCLAEMWIAEVTGGESDGSESNPFGSIQEGIDCACEGAFVHVLQGEFDGSVVVHVPHITIQGAGAIATSVKTPADGTGFLITADDVAVLDMSLTGGTYGVWFSGTKEVPLKGGHISDVVISQLASDKLCLGGGACGSAAGVLAQWVDSLDIQNIQVTEVCGFGEGTDTAGIHVLGAEGCVISHNEVSSIVGASGWDLVGAATGIYVSWSVGCEVTGNNVSNIEGGTARAGGMATGVFVYNSEDCTVSENVIESLAGGSGLTDGGGSAVGIFADDGGGHRIRANTILELLGGVGPFNGGSPGFGAAMGIFATDLAGSEIRDNSIGVLVGGVDCGEQQVEWCAGSGGDAVGVEVRDGDKALVLGNLVYEITAGDGEYSGGNAAGIFVKSVLPLGVVGNTIVLVHGGTAACTIGNPDSCSDGIGVGVATKTWETEKALVVRDTIVSWTSDHCISNYWWSPNEMLLVISHSNLFDCGEAYASNATIEDSCLMVDPLFVDPSGGVFHLHEDSPCIDSGDPARDCGLETQPNGCRVNMGHDGNTESATPRPGAAHCEQCPAVVGSVFVPKSRLNASSIDRRGSSRRIIAWMPSLVFAEFMSGSLVRAGSSLLLAEQVSFGILCGLGWGRNILYT